MRDVIKKQKKSIENEVSRLVESNKEQQRQKQETLDEFRQMRHDLQR
jgi:septation ring formation regulator EzrA